MKTAMDVYDGKTEGWFVEGTLAWVLVRGVPALVEVIETLAPPRGPWLVARYRVMIVGVTKRSDGKWTRRPDAGRVLAYKFFESDLHPTAAAARAAQVEAERKMLPDPLLIPEDDIEVELL